MARRGKTVIGERNLEQSRTMMRAGEAGTAARQRATQGLTGQQDEGFRQGQQLARLGASSYEAGERLEMGKEQQAHEGRMDVASERRAERSAEFTEAREGYERAPGGPGNPVLDREAKLRAEMDRGAEQQPQAPQEQPGAAPGGAGPAEGDMGGGAGVAEGDFSQRDPASVQRLMDQGGKPVEMGRTGQVSPGMQGQGQEPTRPGGLQLSRVGREREDREWYEARTRRLVAEGRTSNRLMGAEYANDEKAIAELQAPYKAAMKRQQDIFTKAKNGNLAQSDWTKLAEWAKDERMQDNPDQGMLQEIIDNGVKSGQGPIEPEQAARFEAFISDYIDKSDLNYTAMFGVPGEFINQTGPMFKKYQQAQEMTLGIMQTLGPTFTQFMGIRDYREKIRFQNRMSAFMTLSGMVGAPAGAGGGGGADVTGGTPAGGGQVEGQMEGQAAGTAQAGGFGEEVPQGPQEPPGEMAQEISGLQQDIKGAASYVGRGLSDIVMGERTQGAGQREKPTTEEGRVEGKQYEYREHEGKQIAYGKKEQEYARKRVALRKKHGADVLPPEGGEGGFGEEGTGAPFTTDRQQPSTRRIGVDKDGVTVYNTIPINSDPDGWNLVEALNGKRGWIPKKGTELKKKRKRADEALRGR